MRRPRFEIVQANVGWHGRFRAKNGRIVWVTEVYERRRAALAAISLIAEFEPGPWPLTARAGRFGRIEVRDVDERGPS